MNGEDKEFIRKTVNSNLENLWDGTDRNNCGFGMWNAVLNAVKGRAASEILKWYDQEPETIMRELDIKASEKGISVNMKMLVNLIWIPDRIIREAVDGRLEILSTSEYRILTDVYNNDRANYQLIMDVLYCIDEERESIGKKFDLFLKNKEWRERAKRYAFVLINHIYKKSTRMMSGTAKGNELLFVPDNSYKKKDLSCLRTIALITELYLNEIQPS